MLSTCSWLGSVCCFLLSTIFLTTSSRSKTWARLLSTATSTRQESGISAASNQKKLLGQSERRNRFSCLHSKSVWYYSKRSFSKKLSAVGQSFSVSNSSWICSFFPCISYPLFWRCSFPVHVGVVLYLCPVGWPDPCAAARCLTAPQAPCWCWSPLHPTNPHLQCPSKSSVCPLQTKRQHRAILLTSVHSVTYIHAVGDDFHLRAVIILLICVWMCAQWYLRSQLIPFCLQTPMNLSSSPTSRSGPLLGLLQLPHHYPGSPDL